MSHKIIIFNILFFCNVLTSLPQNFQKMNIQRCFWANYHHFSGSKKDAGIWFSRLFSENVPRICYVSYIHFLFNARRFSEIYSLKDLIQKEFSSDISLQLLLAQVLTGYGQEHVIHQNLIDLNKKHPEHPELALYVVQIFSSKKEYQEAISCIDNLLHSCTRLPNVFLFHFSKAQIYLHLNNFAEALCCAKESVELFSHFDKTWLMLGLLYEQMGDIHEAIISYKKYLTLTTNPLKEFEQRITMLSLQQTILQNTIEKKIQTTSDLLKTTEHLYEKKIYAEALRHVNILLEHNQSIETKLLKINILLAQNRYKAAIDYIQHSLQSDTHNLLLIEKLHEIALSYNCISTVTKTLKKSLQEKEISSVYVYLADLCLRSQEYHGAIRYLEEAQKNTPEIEHHNAVCFQLALLYYEEHQTKKMKTVLEDAVKKDCTCDYTTNLLAYYYAKFEKNFTTALQYIQKALSISPRNHHYLDTHAFILYKQGNIKEAEIILEQIVKENNEDPFITIHYAKVLLKQKKYAETKKLLQHINEESFPVHFIEKTKKIQNQLAALYN